MKNLLSKLTLTIFACSVTACGMLNPVQSAHQQTVYEISDQSISSNSNCSKTSERGVLFVSPMRANEPYDNTKMYYSQQQYELNTFGYSQWASLPTDMLTQVILKKLYLSCLYKNVATPNALADANYRLVTQLISMRQNVDTSNNTAVNKLVIYAQLIDLDTNKVIYSKVFDEQVNSAPGPKAMASGVNGLVVKFNNDLVTWLSQKS